MRYASGQGFFVDLDWIVMAARKIQVAIYVHKNIADTWIHNNIVKNLSQKMEITFLLSDGVTDEYFKNINEDLKEYVTDGTHNWIIARLYDAHLIQSRNKSKSFNFRLHRFFTGNLIINTQNIKNHPSILFHKIYSSLSYMKANPFQLIFFVSPIRTSFIFFTNILFRFYPLNLRIKKNYNLILIPSSGIELKVNKMLKYCKTKGIKTQIVMENWDNLTSKGLLIDTPDYLSVMGSKCKIHAANLYSIRTDNILVNTIPRFQEISSMSATRRYQRKSRFKIMYLGFSVPHNEHQIINYLYQKFTLKLGAGAFELIYRPHPARQKRYFESHLMVRDNLKILEANLEKGVILPVISKKYFSNLLNVDLVISTPTTMVLEAKLLGIQTVIDGTKDGIHMTSAGSALENYTHLIDLKNCVTDEIAYTIEDLATKSIDVLQAKKARIKSNVQQIVDVNQSFADGLAEFILKNLSNRYQ